MGNWFSCEKPNYSSNLMKYICNPRETKPLKFMWFSHTYSAGEDFVTLLGDSDCILALGTHYCL